MKKWTLRRTRRYFVLMTLLFATVGCDQASKVVVNEVLSSSDEIHFFGNIFRLQLAQNPGSFLSLGANLHSDLRFLIFNICVTLFLLVLAVYLFTQKSLSTFAEIGLTLILAGGLGNLIDRYHHGSVTDFMLIDLGHVSTGIFNIADISIVSGVLLFVASEMSRSFKSAKNSLTHNHRAN